MASYNFFIFFYQHNVISFFHFSHFSFFVLTFHLFLQISGSPTILVTRRANRPSRRPEGKPTKAPTGKPSVRPTQAPSSKPTRRATSGELKK